MKSTQRPHRTWVVSTRKGHKERDAFFSNIHQAGARRQVEDVKNGEKFQLKINLLIFCAFLIPHEKWEGEHHIGDFMNDMKQRLEHVDSWFYP